MNLHCEHYFDIQGFAHKELFESDFVWEALEKIKGYLGSYPLGKKEGHIEPGAHIVHPELISLSKGSVIEAGAYVVGPCIIGENCQVRHGAYIRGDVILGDGCVVGHSSEVKHSIFLDGAKAGHFAYVGDSILGNDVNLGAGTKCANLRFDGKSIRVALHETGRRKLGAILGDGCQTGCNSVTNPGVVMEKGSVCAPCSSISGVVENQVGVL